MNDWTPADVEAETLAGYDPLSAWNRAVSLGGEYYRAWRRENIEPIERRHPWMGINDHLRRWEVYPPSRCPRIYGTLRPKS